MIENKEKNLTGYEQLTNYNEYNNYMLNPVKGTLINKKNRFIAHRNKHGGSLLVVLKNSETEKWVSFHLHELVYEQLNGKLDRSKYMLKHIDKDIYNNSISNIKVEAKRNDRRKKQPVLEVKVTTKKTNTTETFETISEASEETGISRYFFTKAMKREDGKTTYKDIKGNKYKVVVKKDARYTTNEVGAWAILPDQ